MIPVTERVDTFLKEANEKHGDLYDYSKIDYKNANTKVTIICKDHGEFTQRPFTHIRCDVPCPTCAYNVRRQTVQKSKEAEFWNKVKELNTDYDYSLAEYINARTEVKLICKAHGEFSQLPGVHLNGHGCPLCGFEKTSIMRYTPTTFKNNPALKGKDGTIYYLKFTCKSTNLVFYKIGITTQTLADRFSKYYHDKYDIIVVDTLNTNIYDAYLLEQHIKNLYVKKKYVVEDKKFMGRTECFCENILKDLPLKEIYNGFIK